MVEGVCDEQFSAVRDALETSLSERDVGASVAVNVEGEPVVDLWGGYADAARTRPWERDTITNVWSTTKTMVALCALILADRGQLDLDAPVAQYWPEFAAVGKERVLLKHVLSHTAGLPLWDEPLTAEQLYDWRRMTDLLAAQTPRTEPGTQAAYHAITQGFLIGEVVRRATGRTIGQYFAEEVAGPLGADFHIRLALEHDHRVAPSIPPPTTSPEVVAHGPGNPPITPEQTNTTDWRRAEIPSASGYGNARSIAAIQSVLANDGAARGTRLLSKAGCERVLEEQYVGEDTILGRGVRYGMGYGLQGRTCTWGGMGGSLVMVDFDTRMTIAYAMNQMLDEGTLGDERGLKMVFAAYDGVM